MSLLKQLLHVYLFVAYVVMGFIAYKCYDGYQREAAYVKKMEAALERPSSSNFWGLMKSNGHKNSTASLKLRDEAYIAALQQEVIIALLLAPLSLPYYLIVKEGRFPRY